MNRFIRLWWNQNKMQFFGMKDVDFYIMHDFIDGKLSYNVSLFFQTSEFLRTTIKDQRVHIDNFKYVVSDTTPIKFVEEYVLEKSLPFILIKDLLR